MKTKTQFTNRILSLVLSIMMVVSMLPMNVLTASAAEGTETSVTGTATIDLSQYSEGDTINISEDCKIIGDGNEYNILLNIAEDATVIFDVGASGVKLGGQITVTDGKTLTLLVAGEAEHTVNGGISLGNGSNVIIEGDLTKENNKLTVTATDGNAGIGANGGVTAGDITIRNARVDATGSSKEVSADSNKGIKADTSISGAAIGTSDGSMGDILIENSIIVAEGGYYESTSHAAAIGIGYVGSTMGDIILKNSQITAANNGDGLASVIGAGANHHVFVSGSLGDIVITNTKLNLSMAVSTKNWYAAVIGSGIGFSHGYVNMGKIIFTDVTQAELDEMIPTWLPSDFNESQGYALGRGNDGSIYKYDAFGGVWVSDGNGGTVQIGDESGYYINCNKSGFVHDFDEICGGTCRDCGVTYYVVHTMGTAATCTELAVCSVCGESYGDIDADAHNYGDWVSNSDNTHTRTCANDSNHTENGDCSGGTATCKEKAVCDICKTAYGELGGHTYNAAGSCTVCGAVCPHSNFDSATGNCTDCETPLAIAKVEIGGNTTYYQTADELRTAVDSYSADQTITLLADFAVIKGLDFHSDSEAKNTLDLNGHTLTYSDPSERIDVESGELTITGPGSINIFMTADNEGAKIVVGSGVTLNDTLRSVYGGVLDLTNATIPEAGLNVILYTDDWKSATYNVSDVLLLPEDYYFFVDGKAVYTYSVETEGTVLKHTEHSYTYTDNGNGTHNATCTACGAMVDNETHTPAENTTYTDNGDGTHSFTCTVCGTATEAHTYVDRQCDCGAEDTSAYITGVALTVDGVTYTGAEGEGTVYITPTSQITVTIYGANLQNAPKNAHPAVSGSIVWFAVGDGTINEAGTESTIVSSPSEWTHERNKELFLVNVNSSTGDLEFDDDTGIVVTYVTGAGTDLTEIYFNNANAWETITATFYTAEDIYGDSHQLSTAELSLVGGESVIYSTTNIPKNAAYVTFSNGTETTGIIEIPMAADGTNCYKAGVWEHYHHGEVSYALTDDGKQHIATYDCCGATVTENHTATYSASGNVISASCSKCNVTLGNATITAENTIYDGTAQETANVAYSDGWPGSTDLTVTYAVKGGVVLTEAPKNAGTYTASITYEDVTASYDFTIEKATPKAEDFVFAAPTDLIYDGTAKPATITVKDGIVGMGEVNIIYFRDAGMWIDNEREPIYPGRYKVGIWIKEGDNYNAVYSNERIWLGDEFEIKYLTTDAKADISGTIGSNGWYTSDVTLTAPEGYQISKTKYNDGFESKLTISAEKDETITYYLKDANGDVAEKTVELKIDKTAPSAQYQIGTNGWKQFINTITFGLFCKDYKTVDIEYTDELSGVAEKQYYISSEEITDTSSIAWLDYTDTLSLNATGKYLIYMRVVDNAGHEVMLNTEGIVIYEDSVQVTESVSTTYNAGTDKDVTVKLNGNTLNAIKNGNAVLTEGTDYTVSADGTITLKASYLDTLNAGEYTFTVSYNPQGVETDKVNMTTTFTVKIEKADGKVSNLNISGKTYDGTAVTAPTFDKLGDGAATIEYKVRGTDDSTYTTIAPKNVGDYVVRVNVVEGTNHKAASATTYFAIASAELRDVSVQQNGKLTYDGQAQTPTVSVSATSVDGSKVTFTYSTESEGPYSTEIPSFTNAGWAHTVYYRATADNHNTYYGSFLVEIEKATVIEPTIATKPYTGSEQTADVTDTDLYTVVKNEGGTGVKENGCYDVVLELKDSANYKWSTTDNAQVTLQFKITRAENEWTVDPSITGWTYGEAAKAPVGEAKFGEVSVEYSGTTNGGAAYNGVAAPTEAGSYTATFIVQETEDYKGLETSVDFTVAKADYNMRGAKWNYREPFKYDGKEHKVEVVGLPTGVTVESYENNTATAVGDYYAEVNLTYDAHNYNAPTISKLGWTIYNDWSPTEYTATTPNGNGWLNSDFVITAKDGHKVSLTNTADGEWSTNLTYSAETADGSVTFCLKNETDGTISLAKTVTYKLDKTAPTGKVEFVNRNTWEEFVNTITFGLFFKDEVTVKATANDTLSGVDKIEYALASKAMTLDEVKAITDWTEYTDSFGVALEDAKTFVYFVRITDKAGNVTYLSTDGAEYDTTAPVIDGVENGKTYYTTQKVTVTEKNVDTITLNGNPATENITLAGNKEATYTIVVTDKAGNETTVTVTMKPIKELAKATENLGNDNVTSADAPALKELVEILDELIADPDTSDDGEKETLEQHKTIAESLLETIEAAAEATDTENVGKVENVTPENVTPENKTDLENAKADLVKALEENSGNYTEDEKKAIEDELGRINDALEVIGNVEAVEESIVKLPAVDTVKPDDEEAIKAITDAQTAYNALSDYEKSLLDEAAKANLDKLVAALVAYDIVEGDGSSWTEDSDHNITFVVNGLFSKFVGIKVDGKDVDKANYEVKAGSTIITLKASYLDTLAVGEHTITVVYTDGSTDGTFNVHAKANSPATGDNSNMFLWIALLFISGGAVITLAVVDRKKRMASNR